jgi:hypothetical protein
MEMPGSAPGVLKGRWQYCPMRTRRLCGLTLVVLMLHALGWRIACGGPAPFASARAGVHALQIVSVPQGARVPSARAAPGATPPARASTGPPLALASALVHTAPAPGRPHARVTPARRALAGDGGSRPAALAPAPPWPIYATQPPPSATLHYVLVQHLGATGSTEGGADVEWTNSGDGFSLRVATAPADRPAREWQSTGRFDHAGLAPLRLVERERGREKRAVNFDPDGRNVRFSGASGVLAIEPGAQDRWSWVAQLAAIAEAGARRGELAGPWDLQVAGLRGELERWTFQVLPPGDPPPQLTSRGSELSTSGDRAPALLHVLRATQRPYDLRIEAWLSPSLHHFPAGLRMSTPPGPWSLALWQRST